MVSPTTDRRLGLVGNTPIKAPADCATTANIVLSGEQSVDGVLTSASRVLVKNQSDPTQNGIYDSSSAGWTRSADADGTYDLTCGTLVYVTGGATQSLVFYTCTSANPISIGSSAITWAVSVAAGNLAAQLSSASSGSLGSGLSGFNPTLNYVAQTIGRSLADREWNPRDYPWLAKFDGVTDDTAAIQACWNQLYAAGSGTMVMPRGTALVTSLNLAWSAAITVNMRGQGKIATKLLKTGGSTSPVINASNSVGVIDINSAFSDFSVTGTSTAPAMRATNCARFTLDRIRFSAPGGVAFDNQGSLIFETHDSDFRGCATGYKQAAANGIYCNLITFNGGLVTACTTFGFDIDQGSHIFWNNVDMEVNGTNANLATGAVHIRNHVDQETGEAIIGFTGTWLERNHGTALVVDAAAGLRLSFKNFKLQFNDGGLGATIAAINMVSFDNCHSSDSITTAASISRVSSSNLSNLTDTATDSFYEASQINAAVVPWKVIVSGATSSIDTSGVLNGVSLVASADATSGSGVLMKSSVNLLDNTGAGTATLTNSPTAGNPHKWIRINDNGTLRYIPTW